jgi:phytoene dehydrogenase-like protein
MSRSFHAVVIGSDPDALIAAIQMGAAGAQVLVVESNDELGGVLRELEFAPGFRAAPLGPDLGYLDPEAFRGIDGLSADDKASDATVIALGDGEPLLLRRDVGMTAEGLKRFSVGDAARWPEFARQLGAHTGFLAELYRSPAPRIDAGTFGEYLGLARLGSRYRGLGRAGMVELLRALPMSAADWFDEQFESERLKGALAALAVADLCQGPMSGGTAFAFLHRHVGAPSGVIGDRLCLKSGPAALINALAARARAKGVTIETGASVLRVTVRDGRVVGVEFSSGEMVACDAVISSLDPHQSLLGLVDPVHLDPDFIRTVRNIRFRGVATRILVALEGLPDRVTAIPGLSTAPTGALLIAPSVRCVERAYDATKYGRCSDEPIIEIRFPSVAQPKLAPPGQHVAVLRVQYTPYALREGQWGELRDSIADRAFAQVERRLPGFTKRVRARTVLTPLDLETRLGLREGAVSQGEFALDQILFMRPIAGAADGAIPIVGLHLCGPGAHPGPGVLGASGRFAARAALANRR